MKKLITGILFIFSVSIYSQVCVGKPDYFIEKIEKNTLEEIDNFKNTTTVIVLPEYKRTEFDSIIKKYWDITKFEFVSLTEFEKNREKYIFPKYSYLKFENYSWAKQHEFSNWFFLNLKIGYSTIKKFKKNGKSDLKEVSLATVYLSRIMNLKYREPKDYNSGNSIVNYNVGFFKNYVQFINSSLKGNTSFNCLDEYINNSKLKELKTKKLFILQNINQNYQMVLHKETDPNIKELLSKYNYSYELISLDDLQKKILNNEEDFYYLLYSQINENQILSITNSKTGDIIFNYLKKSYYLDKSDFKLISAKIEKSN